MEKNIRLPNCCIVGAAKCGTTSIYHYLKNHPQIYLPKQRKEITYFAHDARDSCMERIEDYRALYESHSAINKKVLIDISTAYLYDVDAPVRIKNLLGERTKIVIFLRNPVKMAFSLWKQKVKDGGEELTFTQAMKAESERMQDDSFKKTCQGWHCNYYYVDRARFSVQVERYFKTFPKENVKVFIFERFFNANMPQWTDLLDFLDVSSGYRPLFRVHNIGGIPTSKILAKLLNNRFRFKTLLFSFFPSGLKIKLKQRIIEINTKEYITNNKDLDTMDSLKRTLSNDVRQLERLIGMSLKELWF